jgi:hypothetical protein
LKRLAALLVASLAGCAFGPGSGFGTLAAGVGVTAGLPLAAARLDTSGGWKTDNGYVVYLDGRGLALEVRDLTLQAPPQSSGTATFDPAKPPPGYTLCHSGHCHRNDGALIDYADVQAELAAGGAGAAATTVLTLAPRTPSLALLPGARATLAFDRCTPSCDLPRGKLTRAPLGLKRLSASGRVTSQPGIAPLPGGSVAWQLELADGLTLAGPTLQVTVDRGQPTTFKLAGELSPSERLFDGLDWARLARQGGTLQLDADPSTREALLANFAKSAWTPRLDPIR